MISPVCAIRFSFFKIEKGRETPHFRCWCFHLIFPSKRKEIANESDRSQSEQNPREEATWCSVCQQLLQRTHTPLPRVYVSVRKAKCNGDARCTASRAHRAGQNMEWSGCDFSSSHPGARTVLCHLCILGNAHYRTLEWRHMLEARGVWAEYNDTLATQLRLFPFNVINLMLVHEIEEPSVTIPRLLMNLIDGSNKREG